jgi:Asp/Glu/hydantoin racemase
MGADGITTNCGFLSLFQEQMAEAVNVPVATSSLMQTQMVQSLLPKSKKVGILTIHKPSLTEKHLKAANVPLDIPIIGTENGKEFTRVILNDEKEMDIDLARQDHLDAVEELMKAHSNIGAIVMECTNMSPFAADVRKKFQVPVFNIYTFIEWFQSGLLPTRFNPDHDDPRK